MCYNLCVVNMYFENLGNMMEKEKRKDILVNNVALRNLLTLFFICGLLFQLNLPIARAEAEELTIYVYLGFVDLEDDVASEWEASVEEALQPIDDLDLYEINFTDDINIAAISMYVLSTEEYEGWSNCPDPSNSYACGYNEPARIFAESNPDPSKIQFRGSVKINSETPERYQEFVILHEFLHALGLEHVDDVNDVMYQQVRERFPGLSFQNTEDLKSQYKKWYYSAKIVEERFPDRVADEEASDRADN